MFLVVEIKGGGTYAGSSVRVGSKSYVRMRETYILVDFEMGNPNLLFVLINSDSLMSYIRNNVNAQCKRALLCIVCSN